MSHFEGQLTLTALDSMSGPATMWRVDSELSFTWGARSAVTVPVGFISDLASVPGWVKAYIDDDSPIILKPSVIHDYVYSLSGKMPDGRLFTREDADMMLREGMLVRGARTTQAAVVYQMVRWFGASHWGP